MGHAYEAISADVIARYHRAYGRTVLFQTGADEHGQKIAEAAEVA
jgi:methionyl-tRNA synthetase